MEKDYEYIYYCNSSYFVLNINDVNDNLYFISYEYV